MWTVFKVQGIRLRVESRLSTKYDKKIDCFSSGASERERGGVGWGGVGGGGVGGGGRRPHRRSWHRIRGCRRKCQEVL